MLPRLGQLEGTKSKLLYTPCIFFFLGVVSVSLQQEDARLEGGTGSKRNPARTPHRPPWLCFDNSRQRLRVIRQVQHTLLRDPYFHTAMLSVYWKVLFRCLQKSPRMGRRGGFSNPSPFALLFHACTCALLVVRGVRSLKIVDSNFVGWLLLCTKCCLLFVFVVFLPI